jgi:hypothetical protein
MTAGFAIVAAAAAVGAMHTLAPDHWIPFAAIARAERWSATRTALLTAACGLGHVTASVALGLVGAWAGLEVVAQFGHQVESVSGLLLIGFGVAYGAHGLHRRIVHAHHAHHHGLTRSMTPWTLFVLFAADPCVAVIPLMFAAMPLGVPTLLPVVVAYEVATITTMVALVLPARAAAVNIQGGWIERWSEPLAGGVVAAVGLIVTGFGI